MPAPDLEFRSYRPADKGAVISLLATGRHPNYAREKTAVFDWQFASNPASDGGPPFLIGTVGDEIVAINGFVPVKVKVRGKAEQGCWSLDTYVSAEHRGKGFGKALVQRVSVRAPVMLGFGISDTSDPIFEKSGWLLDEQMATFFFHVNEPGVKGLGKNLLSRGARLLGAHKRGDGTPLCVEPALAADELDGTWQRVSGHYESAVERSSAYLNWRYRDSPVNRYRWVTARRGGELAALLVTRHHPVESVIADYLGPADDPAHLAGLCDAAVADLVASGTHRIRCETNHPAIKQALAAVGFLPSRWVGRFRVRCNLPPLTTATSGWLVMTGDSDNDLLVF